MSQVPVIRTPFSRKGFARAALEAFWKLEGVVAGKRVTAIVWAQYVLETAAGGFCWNSNLFNHKISDAEVAAGEHYMMLANTWEIVNGKRVVFQPPHRATWFKAYSTIDACMTSHLEKLKTGRYASAWGALLAGEPEKYASKLREKGYYSAPLESYQALMRSGFDQWMREGSHEDAVLDFTRESLPNFDIVHPPVPLGDEEGDDVT